MLQPQHQHGPDAPAPSRAAHVLLIEPDAAVRHLWRDLLERDGHTVRGLRSLNLLTEVRLLAGVRPFDLVIAEGGSFASLAHIISLCRQLPPHSTLLVAGFCHFDWDLKETPGVLLWPKPFPLGDLRRLARRAARRPLPARPPVAIICDDCPHTRELLSTIASKEGFESIATADGADAAALAHSCDADIVLLDIFMPDQDGLITLRQIRAAGLASRIVAFTGGDELFLRVASQLGADHVMTKPLDLQFLRGILRSVTKTQLLPETS